MEVTHADEWRRFLVGRSQAGTRRYETRGGRDQGSNRAGAFTRY
jgi:hypothetical protein